mmetsp:Transcript_2456/g.5475  ORF Transcript_2456/g.5475 Transcript_2456/m.5475 type:complete len:607 (-) Transcript_2456:551-2371(-)
MVKLHKLLARSGPLADTYAAYAQGKGITFKRKMPLDLYPKLGHGGQATLLEVLAPRGCYPRQVIRVSALDSEDDVDCALFEQQAGQMLSGSTSRLVLPTNTYLGCHDGRLVICQDMERVEGVTLQSVIENATAASKASPSRARPVMGPILVDGFLLQAVLALRALHRAGIIHRDIKPLNMMVEPATGRLRIIDFGMAATTGREALRTGGTTDYLAPELLENSDLLPAPEHDMYSLGVVLHHAMCGDACNPWLSDDQLDELDSSIKDATDEGAAYAEGVLAATCSATCVIWTPAAQAHHSPERRALVEALLSRDPGSRAGVREVLASALFSSARLQQLSQTKLSGITEAALEFQALQQQELGDSVTADAPPPTTSAASECRLPASLPVAPASSMQGGPAGTTNTSRTTTMTSSSSSGTDADADVSTMTSCSSSSVSASSSNSSMSASSSITSCSSISASSSSSSLAAECEWADQVCCSGQEEGAACSSAADSSTTSGSEASSPLSTRCSSAAACCAEEEVAGCQPAACGSWQGLVDRTIVRVAGGVGAALLAPVLLPVVAVAIPTYCVASRCWQMAGAWWAGSRGTAGAGAVCWGAKGDAGVAAEAS